MHIASCTLSLPNIVPIVPAMLRPIAPPDNESKLALRAQAHALVPTERKKWLPKIKPNRLH